MFFTIPLQTKMSVQIIYMACLAGVLFLFQAIVIVRKKLGTKKQLSLKSKQDWKLPADSKLAVWEVNLPVEMKEVKKDKVIVTGYISI